MAAGETAGTEGGGMNKIEELERRVVFLEDQAGVVYKPQEAEAGEWVELSVPAARRYRQRVSRDGFKAQQKADTDLCQWCAVHPSDADDNAHVQNYRKGREVALEQTRELVDAVNASPGMACAAIAGVHVCQTGRTVDDAWFLRVRTAAKAVTL
jgi:hypothetical protein